MKKNLIAFLFGESQVDDEIAGIVESIADLDTDGNSDLKVEKKPLAAALSALGIEDKTLENDPRGLSLVFTNAEEYRAAHAILNEPDSLHKLAELGWVYSTQGDVAMANEPAELRFRFLEIDNVEAYDAKATYSDSDKARLNKVKDIIRKGREFATEEPDFDDDCNPVDHADPKKGKRDKGVGDAKDGSDPEGKPKGSAGGAANKSGSAPSKGNLTQPKEGTAPKSVKEAIADFKSESKSVKEDGILHAPGCTCQPCQSDPIGMSTAASKPQRRPWADQMDRAEAAVRPEVDRIHKPHDQTAALLRAHGLGEAGHKSGCQCGFCKNKGNIGNWKKGKKAEKPEAEEVEESEEGNACPHCGKTCTNGLAICRHCGSNRCRTGKGQKRDKHGYVADESTAAEIVNSMLEGNPGTPPGILGTKSFKTMKVPGGSKDRKFSPAKGMVQAAPEGSIVAQQTKPNCSA